MHLLFSNIIFNSSSFGFTCLILRLTTCIPLCLNGISELICNGGRASSRLMLQENCVCSVSSVTIVERLCSDKLLQISLQEMSLGLSNCTKLHSVHTVLRIRKELLMFSVAKKRSPDATS